MSHHSRRGILGRGDGVIPTLSYNSYVDVTAAPGTYTFTGVSFGTAASDRVVVVYISYAASAASSITGVTIAGVAATLAVTANTSSQIRVASIYYASIPSGTSGTVVASTNLTVTPVPGFCVSYSMYGLSSTTPTTGVSNNDVVSVAPSASVTITPNNGGIIVAGYNAGGIAAGTTSTWTNVTEDLDLIYSTSNIITNGSSTTAVNASTTITCTGTDGTVNRPNLIVATWR